MDLIRCIATRPGRPLPGQDSHLLEQRTFARHTWSVTLVLVQPETVVRWHRRGFRIYWRWKSCKKRGKPQVERKIRDLDGAVHEVFLLLSC